MVGLSSGGGGTARRPGRVPEQLRSSLRRFVFQIQFEKTFKVRVRRGAHVLVRRVLKTVYQKRGLETTYETGAPGVFVTRRFRIAKSGPPGYYY